MAALELIIVTTHSVAAMARKLSTPKVKMRNVIVPKEKLIKVKLRQRRVIKKDLEPQSLDTIRPIPPLPNQRVGGE